MINQFARSELLLGKEAMEILKNAHVAIFGVGGVGGFAAEAIARSGVGHITLIDNDVVGETNLNRQIIALHSTMGKSKTQVMKERIADINPQAEVENINMFYLPETADEIDLSRFDYVIDAIDTVAAKIDIIMRCRELEVPVISCMGTGNRMDPSRLCVMDISRTSGCPLAKIMRKELRKRGVNHQKVVFSTEDPVKHDEEAVARYRQETGDESKVIGSLPFVPPVAGLMAAAEVTQDLIKINTTDDKLTEKR